jgi:NTE family protein
MQTHPVGPSMSQNYRPKLGLALGSGSARGLAHIGILKQLGQLGIRPDIICGSSAGSLIGAVSVLGKTQELSDWIQQLSKADILRYMDIKLVASGGFANGNNLIEHLEQTFGNPLIESLHPRFAAVATDLRTGREIWLQSGPIWEAVRASIAFPGLFTPVALRHYWLVDGGLVNPVPVSICRAMGADVIIAVNLNGNLVGRAANSRPQGNNRSSPHPAKEEEQDPALLNRLSSNIKEKVQPLLDHWLNRDKDDVPAIFDVLAGSVNIMQDRITRSRLAGEPADVVLTPRLMDVGLMEFSRSAECISEGEACVNRNENEILDAIGSAGRGSLDPE